MTLVCGAVAAVLAVLGVVALALGSGVLEAAVVVLAIAVTAATSVAALRLGGIDRRHASAVDELTSLKSDLERQVEDRATLLQDRSNQIAVLEDRQRIAADLHDIVIQRLFAAGMFLQGASAGDRDPEMTKRVSTAVEAMDAAIRDLRTSIFELGGRGEPPVDLTTAVDRVCEESSRVLGFRPDVVVDDPDWEAEEAREDILAVVREALANVARHANATRVAVVLRSSGGRTVLTVTDDGEGIGETPHRSGTRNMAERARQRGGTCAWELVEPRGTRVTWDVPVRTVQSHP